MTLKTKMSLLLFLTSISIVSIGFSSWSITAETTAELNGNIQVDNVINNKNMISERTKSYFNYCELGFTKNGLLTKTSEIVVDYNINISECKTYLTKNSLSSEITLKYSVLDNNLNNIFLDGTDENGTSSMIVSYMTENDSEWTIIDPDSKQNNQCITTINFDNLLSLDYTNFEFSIKYEFTVTSGKYFYNNFYSVLNTDDFEFLLSAKLTDYDFKNGGE